MEWFVQTPQYSFKNTLGHSTVLVVFSPGGYHPEYRAGLQDPFSSGVVRLRRMTFQIWCQVFLSQYVGPIRIATPWLGASNGKAIS